MSYFEDAEFQENLESYEQSIENGEGIYMDAEDLTDIAEYYMMHNEEDKANHCIALAIDLHPEAVDPQIFLARQQLFHGNLTEAYAILNQINEQEDREVVFLHAELLLKEKKTEEANNLLSEYYKKIDDDVAHFLYDTSDIFYDYESYEEALDWAKLLIRKYPKYPEAQMLLADIQMKLGNYDEVCKLAEKMLDEDSFNESAWLVLSEALAMQEKCDESLEATEYLLAINEKHPEAMLTRASNLFYLNRIDEAHEQYLVYLDQNPDEYTILYLDGVCLANLERHEEAQQTLLHALEVSNPEAPERVHIHLQLAYVLSKLHKTDQALEQLEQCHNYPTPADNPIDYDLARGHILLENEDYVEAEKYFDLAIKKSKNPYDTLLLIGITLGETGHYTKAADIFQSLHDSTMENAEEKTSPYLAYCHLFLNNREMYLQFLKEAAKLNPNTTQFLFSQFYPGVPVSQYYEMALKAGKGNKD